MKTKVKLLLNVAAILLLLGFAACSKKSDPVIPVVKTDLTAAITAANLLLTTTFEGVAGGNYLKGSQAALTTAVAAAQVVATDATATQITVTNATVALNAAITAYAAQIVTPIDPTNLVGQWTFDQIPTAAVGAVVKDYSGNGRDGTMKTGHTFWGAGNVTLVADRYGIAGKALHFDKGSNVEIPYNTALNPANMSISLWAKQDVQTTIYADQYMVAMNRWNGFKFQMQGTPRSFFTATYDDPAANPPVTKKCCYNEDNSLTLAQGSWWHVVVTFGGGHMIFYVNGVQTKDWVHTGTVSSLASAPVNLIFGQDLPTGGYNATDQNAPNYLNYGGYFVGTLDEVRIYKSILTAAQVTSIYTVEKP